MKNKISSLIVIIIFILSFSFIIKQLCSVKNNKKEIKEEKEEKIVTVIENKNSLYSILLNYSKEDYSYKEYFYETKDTYSNLLYDDEKIKNIDIPEEISGNKIEEYKKENEIADEEIKNEKLNETIDEEIKEEKENEEDINQEEVIITDSKETVDEEVINQDEIIKDELIQEIVKEEITNKKNGFIKEGNITYYYEDDIKITGIKNIDGINHYFNPNGKYLGTNNIKVVDVSYYQGDINWDLFIKESDCYGVILRLGYYDNLDKKFERNINELKRLNIPYGIYLFSYSTTMNGSNKEANFTNDMIDKYHLTPVLGIYYDIESWSSTSGSSSNNITKEMYDNIITNYISKVSNHINNEFKVKVYSGRWYAMNRLGDLSRSYVDWVAEYNSTCKYDGNYSLWQYTSKGNVAGINGNVDISYIINN